jgi:transcriptional regulator with GAF, ATPase, and Fis domain
MKLSRTLLSLIGVVAIIYCVTTLAFVVTNPDLRLRAMLVDEAPVAVAGVTVHAGPAADKVAGAEPPPQVGDTLIEVYGRRIRNFTELARVLIELRYARLDPGGRLFPGSDPSELATGSSHQLVEIDDGKRFTKIRFVRRGESTPSTTWVQLQSLPMGGLMLSLIWLVPQLVIFALSAIAYWHRPHDASIRLFYLLTLVTLVAFVGGGHWWVVAGSVWLCVPFVIAAMLLPAILLHLFLVYPSPRQMIVHRPRLVLGAVYGPPVLGAGALSGVILTLRLITSQGRLPGPFARCWDGLCSEAADILLYNIHIGLPACIVVASGYFLLSLASLWSASRSVRNNLERRQVQWILWAGLVAALPAGYATYLAVFRRVDLALGSGQVPMLLASVCFMLAYAVGMVRYKLMLVDEVVSRGMMYYVVSSGLTGVFSLAIAGGSVLALRQEMPALSHAVSVTVVLTLTIIVLGWLRDRLQRLIDRRFYEERYQLDRALSGMNRAVAACVDRKTLADQMLVSCCDVLGVRSASCYLREAEGETFRRLAVVGNSNGVETVTVSRLWWSQLQQGVSVQRLRSGGSNSQQLIRLLRAELIHGIEVDGELVGLITLGAKSNGTAFTADDGTFLTAMERITGFALHFAKVHEEFRQLNAELESRTERLSAQDRRISFLERQLTLQSPGSELMEAGAFRAPEMIGRSRAMREVLETVRKVAVSEASVLIRGESGTGKELLAAAIHENGPRRQGPLVTLHCAALSPTLLESELFGHVRGAFTDARDDKVGRIQRAHGGTLFLDEIGDISLDVQVKLLRVLQQRTFEPVGSHHSVHVDVRIIAATHRHLERLIAEGTFREDLYYRLNVISVTLPPLRERGDDVLDLAAHFLARANERTGKAVTQIDDAAVSALLAYHWPGNIRELENVIERAVVLAEGHAVTLHELPDEMLPQSRVRPRVMELKPTAPPRLAGPRPGAIESSHPETRQGERLRERAELLQALQRAGGNKAEAARLLGLPRSTLVSRLKKLGFD